MNFEEFDLSEKYRAQECVVERYQFASSENSNAPAAKLLCCTSVLSLQP